MIMTHTDGSRWVTGVTRQFVLSGELARLVDDGEVTGARIEFSPMDIERVLGNGDAHLIELCQRACDEMTYTWGGSGGRYGILIVEYARESGQTDPSDLIERLTVIVDRPNATVIAVTNA